MSASRPNSYWTDPFRVDPRSDAICGSQNGSFAAPAPPRSYSSLAAIQPERSPRTDGCRMSAMLGCRRPLGHRRRQSRGVSKRDPTWRACFPLTAACSRYRACCASSFSQLSMPARMYAHGTPKSVSTGSASKVPNSSHSAGEGAHAHPCSGSRTGVQRRAVTNDGSFQTANANQTRLPVSMARTEIAQATTQGLSGTR
jgi:hypothetical protein